MLSSIFHMYHFACLRCRRSVKGERFLEISTKIRQEGWRVRPQKCSQCGGEMPCMGKHFTPPRRNDEKQWKKLEYLISQGWPRANWQTTPAMSLREVRETEPERIEGAQKRLLMTKSRRTLEKQMQKSQRQKTRKARQKKRRTAKEWTAQCQYQEQVVARMKND